MGAKRTIVALVLLALLCAPGCALNVGSGSSYTVRDVAELLATVLGAADEPQISGKYRVGDIRHCFADVTLASVVLGYTPRVTLEEGLVELSEWVERQVAEDRLDQASAELASRGLTV